MRRPLTTLIALTALLCALCACSRKVYVPVEHYTHTTDTLRTVRLLTDTVIDRDTVLLSIRGDTVTREVIRWRWRVKERTDTLYRSRLDSVLVPQPYEVVKEVKVEKPLHWWQKGLMGIGALASIALLAVIIWTLKKIRS